MDYRIISIGALSRHELWNEAPASRSAHSTCTLIRSGKQVILVDPGLPGSILEARLAERAGLKISAITDVFLTNFRPSHRRGLEAFPKASWFISQAERETVGQHLVSQFQQASDEELDAQVLDTIKEDIALLQRCKPAPDQLAQGVDLFPVNGFTPGTTGLLLALPHSTVLIASDAIATEEHLDQGRVLRGAYDIEQAKESLMEIVEIADVIIPGHDNTLINRTKRPF